MYLYKDRILVVLIIVCTYLLSSRFNAVTLWPFIVLKHKDLKHDAVLLHHERIHLRQQLELLVIPFYVWYVVEWLILCCKYNNRFEAYRNISFEKEAYQNEKDLNFLQARPFWNFLKFY